MLIASLLPCSLLLSGQATKAPKDLGSIRATFGLGVYDLDPVWRFETARHSFPTVMLFPAGESDVRLFYNEGLDDKDGHRHVFVSCMQLGKGKKDPVRRWGYELVSYRGEKLRKLKRSTGTLRRYFGSIGFGLPGNSKAAAKAMFGRKTLFAWYQCDVTRGVFIARTISDIGVAQRSVVRDTPFGTPAPNPGFRYPILADELEYLKRTT